MTRKKTDWVVQSCPPPLGDVMHVARVSETGRVSGVCICDNVFGPWVHWVGRTVRCVGLDNRCPHCLTHVNKKWVGFIQLHVPAQHVTFMIEVTNYAGLQLKAIRDAHETLRGLRLEFKRARDNMRAPLMCELLGLYHDVPSLPPEKPFTPTLDRLWSGYRKGRRANASTVN
jgi:hypothetical protein